MYSVYLQGMCPKSNGKAWYTVLFIIKQFKSNKKQEEAGKQQKQKGYTDIRVQ